VVVGEAVVVVDSGTSDDGGAVSGGAAVGAGGASVAGVPVEPLLSSDPPHAAIKTAIAIADGQAQ